MGTPTGQRIFTEKWKIYHLRSVNGLDAAGMSILAKDIVLGFNKTIIKDTVDMVTCYSFNLSPYLACAQSGGNAGSGFA